MTAEVLAEKFVSPLYFAVMECEPADRLESGNCAELLETVAVPKDVVPSRKVTLPVAPPPKAVWIVAVNVTDWPKEDGFELETKAVVVDAPFTTWLRAADVLPVRFAFPA